MKFTHRNDLNGQKCTILKDAVVRQELVDAGVTPSSTMLTVENEDGTKEQIFPWEVTKIEGLETTQTS